MNNIIKISFWKTGNSHRFLYALFFLSFITSMNCWIGWEGRSVYINLFVMFCSFLIIKNQNIRMDYSLRNIITFCLFVIGQCFVLHGELRILNYLSFFQFLFIICLNDRDKIRCINYIIKWMAWLMLISIVVYVLDLVIGIPSLGKLQFSKADYLVKNDYGICDNLIFYIRSKFEGYEMRFNGPFLEPGQLGMMLATLLLIFKFDIKRKDVKIIIIAILLTLSLAGYMLAFIAFFIVLLVNNRIKMSQFVIVLVLIVLLYCYGVFWDGGNNVINEKILSRLQADEESGFTGNNRSFGMVDLYFAGMWYDTKTMWFGYSKETIEWLAENGSRGAGFVMWMVKYGLLGTIVSIISYLYYMLTAKNKKFAFLIFVFFGFMFWQRSYPFWSSWIICYIYGITWDKYKNGLF